MHDESGRAVVDRPVGAPPGIETVSGSFATGVPPTAPEYRVDTSVPLSATHAGVVGPKASPHAFTRFGSAQLRRAGDVGDEVALRVVPEAGPRRRASAGGASASPTAATSASAAPPPAFRVRRARGEERMEPPGSAAGRIRPFRGAYAPSPPRFTTTQPRRAPAREHQHPGAFLLADPHP